jgi:hypothetical protein
MSRWVTILAFGALIAACHRTVVVRSGATPRSSAVVRVDNRLQQTVNVYVVSGGSDHLLGQVPAATTANLGVPEPLWGLVVQLKARTADGTLTFTRDGVTLRDTVYWELRSPGTLFSLFSGATLHGTDR